MDEIIDVQDYTVEIKPDYSNKSYLSEGAVYFQNFEGEVITVGNIEDIDIVDGMLNGVYPLEERFECEAEIIRAWNELYPEGKPQPIVEPVIVFEIVDEEKVAMAEAIISFEERITALEAQTNGGV